MKPNNQELGAINAASPTPLNAVGNCDLEATRSLCRRWRELPLDGVLLLGSMGEGPLLADRTRDSFLDCALTETNGALTLFVSVADLSRQRMIERARRYAAMGARWIVITATPGQSVARAAADIRSVADASPVPCIYYDVPVNTGVSFNLDDLLALAAHPNIRGIKDSTGNALLAQALTSPAHRPPGFMLLDGTEYRTAHSAALGYDGVIHGGGVLTARAVRRVWDLAGEGHWKEAFCLDRENSLFLATVYNRFSRPLQNIAGQKYALQLLNVFRSADCSVDQAVDDSSRTRIAQAVEAYRHWLS
jgi:dihydrodipicolinate synthase/N-acetylneuraminate lyase